MSINRYLNDPKYVLYFYIDEKNFYIYSNDEKGLEAAEKELCSRGTILLKQGKLDEAFKLSIDAVPLNELSTPSERSRRNITDIGELKEKLPSLKTIVYESIQKKK